MIIYNKYMSENNFKFNFEKHGIPEKPKEEKVEKEKIQEELESEIIAETEKLGLNLHKLKEEIDQYGGVEKFKEYFEGGMGSQNEAGKEIHRLNSESRHEKTSFYTSSKIAASLLALTAYFDYRVGIASGQGKFDDISTQIEKLKDSILSGDKAEIAVATTGVVIVAIPALMTGIMSTEAIKNFFKMRRLNKEKQKQELKFKMTGTEVKQ